MQKEQKTAKFLSNKILFFYIGFGYVISFVLSIIDKLTSNFFNLENSSSYSKLYLKNVFNSTLTFLFEILITFFILKGIFKIYSIKKDEIKKFLKRITVYFSVLFIFSILFSFFQLLIVNVQYDAEQTTYINNIYDKMNAQTEEEKNNINESLNSAIANNKKELTQVMYGALSISILKHILTFSLTLLIIYKFIKRNMDTLTIEEKFEKEKLSSEKLVFKLIKTKLLYILNLGVMCFVILQTLYATFSNYFETNNFLNLSFKILLFLLPAISVILTTKISTKYIFSRYTFEENDSSNFKALNLGFMILGFFIIFVVFSIIIYAYNLYLSTNTFAAAISNENTDYTLLESQFTSLRIAMQRFEFATIIITFLISTFITNKYIKREVN